MSAPEVESARGRKKRKETLTQFLRENPDGVTISSLVRELGVSEPTARRYLMELPVRNLRPRGDEGLYVLAGGRSDGS